MKLKTILFPFLAGIVTGTFLAIYYGVILEVPQTAKIEKFTPQEPLRIISADHKIIDEIGSEFREFTPLKSMAKCVTQAVVSAEDTSFFKHLGISIRGILRATLRNILKGRIVEGGSTITQQLIKNTVLSPERSLRRKLVEALLALKVERKLSKEEILELYLNQVYFGNGSYGIKLASEFYFQKHPSKLLPHECALLAALLKSPSRYNPYTHPQKALLRRNYILRKMFELNFIKKDEYLSFKKQPLGVKPLRKNIRIAPFFSDYILSSLEEELGKEVLYNHVSEIHTTLDYRLQMIAKDALTKGIKSLVQRHRKLYSKYGENPEGCVIIISVKRGEILAMVGGSDYSKTQFNRCVKAKRMTGSAIKPFIYVTAIEKGLQQNYVLWDLPVKYRWHNKVWTPSNYDGKYRGIVTLREALIQSLNVPTVRLASHLGLSTVAKSFVRFGLPYPGDLNLSIALGTISASPLTLTSAYAVFFNRGLKIKIHAVKTLKMKNGEERQLFFHESKRVISEDVAFVIKDMLKGVIKNGTGSFAREFYPLIGGKTGTTQDYRDAWFIGCSDQICIGVWVGLDSGRSLGHGETGAKAAGRIFLDILKKLPPQYLSSEKDIPPNIVFKKIDLKSGEFTSKGEKVAFIKTP